MISNAKKKKRKKRASEDRDGSYSRTHPRFTRLLHAHLHTHTLAQILSASWHERRVTSNLGVIQVK